MENKRTEISTLGEFGLIEHLTALHQTVHPNTIEGIGDDAAVLDRVDSYELISTDLLLEGIHFDLAYHPLKHLGYKAVVANVSDICAMNGTAEQITVSVGVSSRFSVEAMEELYDGIFTACKYYGLDLIGGDTTSSRSGLMLSITAIGRVAKTSLTLRSGAKPGDILCLTGDLGAAYLGLQLLEREKQLFLAQPDIQPDLEDKTYIVGKQLKPEARNDMIELFRNSSMVPTSMIDISDGLASEILHLSKNSNVGFLLEESKIPITQETQMAALDFHLDPVMCALNGGEDYELLFTAKPEDLEKVRTLPGIYIIGEVLPLSSGNNLLTSGGRKHPITAQGWQHFNQNQKGEE